MDAIFSFLQDFDVANLLPEAEQFLRELEGWTRFGVLLGPLLLVALGAFYYFAPPREANHAFGFRTYWGMGSVQAWLFAQKLAGMGYMAVGGALTILMGLISLSFRGHAALSMINTALVCVLIELLGTLALWVCLNILIFRAYDKDGNRRLNR